MVNFDAIIDGKRYMMEYSRGKKGSANSYQLTPRLKIDLHGITGTLQEFEGLLTVRKGPKTLVRTELFKMKEGKRMRLAKAEFSQEKSGSRMIRSIGGGKHRTTLSVSLGGIKHNQWINFVGTAASNSFKSLDAVLDYKSILMRKSEKIKLTGKYSNKGTSDLIHTDTMGEMTFTEFPQFNFHVNTKQYLKVPAGVKLDLMNYLLGSFVRHEEDELTVKWGHKMDVDQRKVEFKFKLNTAPEGVEKKMNERFTMFIGPVGFNREYVGDYKWSENKYYKGT